MTTTTEEAPGRDLEYTLNVARGLVWSPNRALNEMDGHGEAHGAVVSLGVALETLLGKEEG